MSLFIICSALMKYLTLIFYLLLNKVAHMFHSLLKLPLICDKVVYQVFVGKFLSPVVSTCFHT